MGTYQIVLNGISVMGFYEGEVELMSDILMNYNRDLRPIRDYSKTMNISVNAVIRRIEMLVSFTYGLQKTPLIRVFILHIYILTVRYCSNSFT